MQRGQPIRTEFDPADIGEPLRWLSKPHGRFFYKKGRPVFVAGEMWNTAHPASARFPSPVFSNRWTGRFDGRWAKRVGLGKVEEFVTEAFQVTGSDFGFLTTEVDLKFKNTSPTRHSFQGFDMAKGLPGLYWVNLFSDSLGRWLELSTFPQELASLRRLAGGGWLLQFCELPDHCRDIDLLQKQCAAIEWLGADKFFDIRCPEREARVPNWDSAPFRDVESSA